MTILEAIENQVLNHAQAPQMIYIEVSTWGIFSITPGWSYIQLESKHIRARHVPGNYCTNHAVGCDTGVPNLQHNCGGCGDIAHAAPEGDRPPLQDDESCLVGSPSSDAPCPGKAVPKHGNVDAMDPTVWVTVDASKSAVTLEIWISDGDVVYLQSNHHLTSCNDF